MSGAAWHRVAASALAMLTLAGGCGPRVGDGASSAASGTETSSDSDSMGSASAATNSSGAGGSSTGQDVTCPDGTDLVVDRACYRHLELDDVRVWQMDKAAAVHLTGGPEAEILVGTPGVPLQFVIVSLAGDVPRVVAELDQDATVGALWGEHHWPPVALDVDADGRDEAVFGTYPGPVVYVVSWDPSTGGYAMTARDDVLPEYTGNLMLATDVDADDDPELIALTWPDDGLDPESHLVVVDRVTGRWQQVGTTLLAPELHASGGIDVLEIKAIAPDDRPAAKLGYIHDDEDIPDAGVTIVRVDDGFNLVQEARLEAGFSVDVFSSGDFDGDGFADVHMLGFDHDAQRYENVIFSFDGNTWSRTSDSETRALLYKSAGDMTGNGAADLLDFSVPMHAIDLSDGREAVLADMAYPVVALELSGDALGDLLYRAQTEPAPDTSTATTLHFLMSLD